MFPREICHLATNVSLASQRIAANSDFPRNLIYGSREIIFPYDSSRFPRDKKTTLGKQVNSSSVIKGHKCGIFLGNIDKDTFGVTVLVGFIELITDRLIFRQQGQTR